MGDKCMRKVVNKDVNKTKIHTHIGVYGLVIKNDKILLIKKVTGPYDGKLDLPGGSFEFGETPTEVLVRELQEEVGITPIEYELYDADSVIVKWNYKGNIINVHHVGMFYKVVNYEGIVKEIVELDEQNDDSLGASFYNIRDLKRDNLSLITILELEKLGYQLDWNNIHIYIEYDNSKYGSNMDEFIKHIIKNAHQITNKKNKK